MTIKKSLKRLNNNYQLREQVIRQEIEEQLEEMENEEGNNPM